MTGRPLTLKNVRGVLGRTRRAGVWVMLRPCGTLERLGHLAARAEKPPTFRRGHFEARAMGLGWRWSGTKTGL